MSRGEVSVPPRLAAVAGPSTGATGWSSAAHGSSMTHEEVEFCAEEELVTIVPAFRKDAPLALLSGKYGPFIPQARRPCLSAPTGARLPHRRRARSACSRAHPVLQPCSDSAAALRRLRGRRTRAAGRKVSAHALALTRPACRRCLAQVPIQVPLWMAVALATRAKCVIQPPQWMDPPALEEVLRKERESEAEFQVRPSPHAWCTAAAVSASLCAVAPAPRLQRRA